MSINLNFFLLFLVIAAVGGYVYRSIRKNPKTAVAFGAVWTAWVMILIPWGIQMTPRPSPIPPVLDYEIIFGLYLAFILVPNLLVLIIAAFDMMRRGLRQDE